MKRRFELYRGIPLWLMLLSLVIAVALGGASDSSREWWVYVCGFASGSGVAVAIYQHFMRKLASFMIGEHMHLVVTLVRQGLVTKEELDALARVRYDERIGND